MLRSGPVRALGAMSGTSLDGIDAAVIETDGEAIFGFGRSAYRAYLPAERVLLRAALGRWSGPEVKAAAALITRSHQEVLAGFPEAAIIGFHGQTLAHDPRGQGTLQVGDGAALARALDRPVVWDFRSNDVAMGGEGAPLAPFYHFALARWIGATAPLAFLNLGGVGNLTWVDPSCATTETAGALLAFDTGPANAPLNDLMQARRGVAQDEGGRLALSGRADPSVVAGFLNHPFFDQPPPKSLDRDAWAGLQAAVAPLGDADAAATLTACAVAAVKRGISHCPVPPARLLVTGGGRHNHAMMAGLAAALSLPVEPVESAGLDGDMLEAQAFAYLAVRVACGLPISAPGTTGVARPMTGGRISQP